MRQLLRKENVLILGDSTARQDYFTMYNLMNARDPSNISYKQLDHGIKVNKKRITEPCTLRNDPLKSILIVCRQVPGLKRDSNGTASETFRLTSQTFGGAFDMTPNPGTCNCFLDVSEFIQNVSTTLSSFYSVLVFSMGIRESFNNSCTASGKDALLWNS
jgi:hypothetical protein